MTAMKASEMAISSHWTGRLSLVGETRRWRRGVSLVAIAIPPPAPGLDQVDDEEQREGDHQHDRGDDGGANIVEFLQADVDQQRRDLGDKGNIAGDEDDRAIFADGAGEGEG